MRQVAFHVIDMGLDFEFTIDPEGPELNGVYGPGTGRIAPSKAVPNDAAWHKLAAIAVAVDAGELPAGVTAAQYVALPLRYVWGEEEEE